MAQHRIALFASGAGSNAQKILEYFSARPDGQVRVGLVVTNKPDAGVVGVAGAFGVETLFLERERFFRGDGFLETLQGKDIDFIVLAGFLWKIPPALVRAYPRRMINLHPALLPKFGGKGMYGHHVHQAVLDKKESKSGITVHYVDEFFDHGQIIFQAVCPVLPTDDADALATRIHGLEHRHFPAVVALVVSLENIVK